MSCKIQKEMVSIEFQNVVQNGRGPWFPEDKITDEGRDFLSLVLKHNPADRLTAIEGMSN